MTGPYGWMNRAAGMAECRLEGAQPEMFFNRCAAAGVPVYDVQQLLPGSTAVQLRQRDLRSARRLAVKSQCELYLCSRRGGRAWAKHLARRWVLLVCALALLATAFVSRLFLWEIEVQGNETVSSGHILNALRDCGVAPGSFWPKLTGDHIRSELLLRLPELAWATVNVYGSRAEVIVRERVPKPELFDAHCTVDLAAERLGFVTQVRALNGTALVQPGSAVVPGDILIAGFSESAFSGTREVHAVGSVIAETYYELSAVLPASARLRVPAGSAASRWALEIGTKRINFYRNSSICPADCDKLTEKWECKIPGLFTLPVALVRERLVPYTVTEQPRDANAARRMLEEQLSARLAACLGPDGEALETYLSCSQSEQTLTVCLRARCREEIAVEQERTQEE